MAGWLEAEHFLGALRPVGHTLIQFVEQENQVVVIRLRRLAQVMASQPIHWRFGQQKMLPSQP
jgi:hypothetical protein